MEAYTQSLETYSKGELEEMGRELDPPIELDLRHGKPALVDQMANHMAGHDMDPPAPKADPEAADDAEAEEEPGPEEGSPEALLAEMEATLLPLTQWRHSSPGMQAVMARLADCCAGLREAL